MLLATLAVVVVRQLTRRGPPIWIAFAAGAFGMVATGVLSIDGALAAVVANAPVPVFLLGLFLLGAGLDDAGTLERMARWIVRRARDPSDLPMLVFLAFGGLSAFVVNDALALVGVPVALSVARRAGVSPRPLLLALMAGVTIGSVPTPFGNPQNLLVSLSSGIDVPVLVFARYLALPTLLALGAGALLLRRRWRAETQVGLPDRGSPEPPAPTEDWRIHLRRHPTVAIFPVTIVAIVLSDLSSGAGGTSVPLDLLALAGGLAALALSPRRRTLLYRVDLRILALFVALFVVVAGAVAGGVVGALGSLTGIPGPSSPAPGIAAIVLTSLLGSQVVSNVPWVALQIPVLHGLGYGSATPVAWMALAGASTLAGNVSLLGAASNLIVVAQAERAGITVRLGEFLRVALPLAAVSLVILFGCLVVGL